MWIRGLNALHKPLLHPLPSQFAAAVRDRPLHSGEDHRVVSLECVEELQEDRNAGEAGVADVDGEPPYVEEPALVNRGGNASHVTKCHYPLERWPMTVDEMRSRSGATSAV